MARRLPLRWSGGALLLKKLRAPYFGLGAPSSGPFFTQALSIVPRKEEIKFYNIEGNIKLEKRQSAAPTRHRNQVRIPDGGSLGQRQPDQDLHCHS
jgi:hypothetical protein